MSKRNQTLKRERFLSVGGRRVHKVLESLDKLSKCSNRNNYEYSDEDVIKMMKAIKEKVKILEAAYTSNTKSATISFQF
ncbi:MAG TPA: hypothetical protein VK508_12145 [Cyclobacteriaceae bacterium]|nr:hypothetical protein [Cyclobacteriaceae bacterium]